MSILVILSIAMASIFCKTNHLDSNTSQFINNCCIDTFQVKYEVDLGNGRLRKYEINFYVGILPDTFRIGGKTYQKLLFGDSLNSVIAFVRQTDEGLFYIDTSDSEIHEEKTLLHFNKKMSDQWKVNINDSYFWRKDVTFAGTVLEGNEEVYVYDMETDKDYLSLGENITKIYYSKEKGFLKFILKTHWARVEVSKVK